jgi:hypothetical protein
MPDTKVKLSRPLVTHKGELKELTLREPTARDFIEINKLPVRFKIDAEGGGREVMVDYETLFRWASHLTDIGVDILGTLKKRDVQSIVEAIQEILGDEAEDVKTDIAKN